MIKEIGSIYPLKDLNFVSYNQEIPPCLKNRVLFSLCREALKDIALLNENSNKIVLIPAYTCQTVITPFEESGWKAIFYPIKKDLRIDTDCLVEICQKNKPSLLVVHPFYGMDLNKEEENVLCLLRSEGVKIVIDLTQCIFSIRKYSYCEYQVGSYRKWFPIPDGAYLKCNEPIKSSLSENTDFSDMYSWAMYLRRAYFENGDPYLKSISIALSKKAEEKVESGISCHKISGLSLSLISNEDFDWIQKRRLRNHSLLHQMILDREGTVVKVCKNVDLVTTAPLYFTLYIENRKDLQRLLAENSVYAPVLWPVENIRVLVNKEVEYIYDHILAIPCDQRYSDKDMIKISNIINSFNNEK